MALASNDFADETEYLKLLTMMVMKRAFSSNPIRLILKNFPETAPPDFQITLAWRSLPRFPLFGSLHGV